jgi:rhodanese-related sulfurtransferase
VCRIPRVQAEYPAVTGYIAQTARHNAGAGTRGRFARMKHLKPGEAVKFLEENPSAVFIDCRSEMEYYFVGHPVGAHHVAWNDGPDWDVNPHFVGQVKKVTSASRPVVLICRSGHRSIDAGMALEKAGFAEVYNVLEGFEGPLDDDHHRGTISGWRKEGLPWEQL